MTPIEKIIVKHYVANTFMFNPKEDKYYSTDSKLKVLLSIKQSILSEQNVDLSVEQIKRRWKDLRDTFVKADNKTNKKDSLSYYEKSIYQRLYFLRPYVIHKDAQHCDEIMKFKNSSTEDMKMCNYERRSNAQVHEKVTDGILNETEKYLINIKKSVCNDAARILNGIIQQYTDKHTQILCLNLILKCIAEFRSSHC